MALADPLDGLLSFLQQEEQSSRDTALDNDRAAALSFYLGDPYGNEVDGRSQLVTREVASTTDFDLISILRTCTSTDRIVEFEVDDVSMKQAEDEAGRLIHFTFMRKQNGYRVLQDWVKLGLLEKTGIVKTWCEHKLKPMVVEVPEQAFGQNDDGTLHIDGNQVVGEPEHINPDEVIDDGMGGTMPAPAIHRATVKIPLPPAFRTAAVPNEEFGASPDTVELDDSPYLYHAQQKSLSELHEMGFEFDDATLWGDNPDARVISNARDSQRSKRQYESVRPGPMRLVWFREEYTFFDLNGDGIAERIKVERVGRTILTRGGKPAIEEIDDQPFVEWCPYPMPARRVGQSLADKCMDIQYVNSTLLRQGMDSLYQSTNPRVLLHENSIGDNTIDDLLTVRSGGLIRYIGAAEPTPWATLPVHEQAFNGMEMQNNMLETRTGVTRMNQGLDRDTFDRTATGTQLIQGAGETMQEYRARNFVEGFRVLALKMYKLMRQYGQPVQMIVNGKQAVIDPTKWPEEINVKVNVGLGTGNKDKRLMLTERAIESASNGMEQGSPLFTPTNLYNLTVQWLRDADIGNPADYVTQPPEPEEGEGQDAQSKPDPEAIKAQGEAQATVVKEQSAHEQAMARLQLQQEEQQTSAALKSQQNDQELAAKREKAALDIELARQKAEAELTLAQQQQAFEMDLAERRFQFDQEMARKKAQQASESDSNITNYREGGSLDA